MVPSALPATSAPTRVSLVPSCLASCGLTAWAVPRTASSVPARSVLAKFMDVCSFANVWRASQGGLEREDHEASVREQRVGAAVGGDHVEGVGGGVAEEVHVLQIEAVLRVQVDGRADGIAAGPLVAAQQHGGVAAQATGVADRQGQVGAREDLVGGGREV